MNELLTAAQMRAVESAAIGAGNVTGLTLMEKAGQGVVEAIETQLPKIAATRGAALVLCGPGNNGGDGFVVARLLAARGWQVSVYLYGDPDKLPPDAYTNYLKWREIGPVKALSASTMQAPDFPPPCALLVDALFGTGLRRAVALPLDLLSRAPDQDHTFKVVAVDIPSGLCSDSGRIIGPEAKLLPADLTVSFHRLKLGHVLADGPELCGISVVADIGL